MQKHYTSRNYLSMNVAILCVSDNVYLPILEPLIRSLKVNSRIDYNLNVRLINCNTTPGWLADSQVIHDNINISTKRNKLISDGYLLNEGIILNRKESSVRTARWLYSDFMAYCVNVKFGDICRLLSDERNDIVIYLDADTIIRDSLEGLVDMLHDRDILVRMTASDDKKKITEPHGVLYHIGMMLINNSEMTRKFYQKLDDMIKQDDFYNWDTDQIQFSHCVNMTPEIRIGNIPSEYKDESMSESSIVWCGASSGKITDDRYISEMTKYRE